VSNSTTTEYAEQGSLAREEESQPGDNREISRDRPAAVELMDVARRLGSRWALRGVALRVEAGEVVAVVGPNGSGKTTLLRVVATSLSPTRGSGRVFGNDLVRDADAVRETIGLLGHATGLYDDLTVSENLEFAMRMYGTTPSGSLINEALDLVGMLVHARERVRILSSGMRRRVALARLILRRPRLLLLDEPYNTLDTAGVGLVDGIIRDTVRLGGAALVVTHDLDRTDRVAYDRVVTLRNGRVHDSARLQRESPL
jgi:heme exporter protein A